MTDEPIFDAIKRKLGFDAAGQPDPGHLLPADEWARVVQEATGRDASGRFVARPAAPQSLARSAFPSVTGFVQCRWDGGARPGAPTFAVLHDAETPLSVGYGQSIAAMFARGAAQTSAHFMVDPAVTVQMLDTARIGWHVGNGNPRSIGVEQAGYAAFTASQWTTPDGQRQMARVAALMRDLRAAHGIGLYWMTDAQLRDAHAGRIVGGWATHDQCSRVLGGSTHSDPMPYYPLAQLMALANGTSPLEDDDMPYITWPAADKAQLCQDVATAIANRPVVGTPGGADAVALWLALNQIHSKVVREQYDLSGRPADRKDDLLGHVLSTEARVEALAAEPSAAVSVDASAFLAALKADPDAMALLGAAFAKAVNDDAAKRLQS